MRKFSNASASVIAPHHRFGSQLQTATRFPALLACVALLSGATANGQTTLLIPSGEGYDFTQGGTVQVVDPGVWQSGGDPDDPGRRFWIYNFCIISSYSQPANLEGAQLGGFKGPWYAEGASLVSANLDNSTISFGYFTNANLEGASFEGAAIVASFFEGANLEGASFKGAFLNEIYLDGASFEGANLSLSVGLETTDGSAFYDRNTDFTGTGFDPAAAGWIFVPEPTTFTLLGLGSLALVMVRRRK